MEGNDFKINYWAPKDYMYEGAPQKKRSFKKKIFIVFCFIAVLLVTPSLFFGVSNLKTNTSNEVSMVVATPTPKQTEQAEKTPTPTPKPTSTPVATKTNKDQKEVINNDSYWKISKRNCGTGKYYLSIQNQNDAKPLHVGDKVIVTCELN